MKTVHQPLVSASFSGRNDVTNVPKVGMIHSRQRTVRTSLVSQPALAGLGSKVAAFRRVLDVGVATATVAVGSVMPPPPLP